MYYLPRKAENDCLQELRWLHEHWNVEEARRDLKCWLEKWAVKYYPKLCAGVETNIEENWTFYRLPVAHHKHLKSTNLLERFNQEIKRRTLGVQIFPGEVSCLRPGRPGPAIQRKPVAVPPGRPSAQFQPLSARFLLECPRPVRHALTTRKSKRLSLTKRKSPRACTSATSP